MSSKKKVESDIISLVEGLTTTIEKCIKLNIKPSQAQDIVERQKVHFEGVSKDYFDATQNPICLLYNTLLWKHFLLKHPYILPENGKVLEPMCGHGVARDHLLQHLHDRFQYTGFDYSQPLVDIAQHRMPNANVYLQDITTYSPTERYDLLFLAGGLHHVYAQTRDVLERLRQAIVPGGYMISYEPTYDNALYGMLGRSIYKNNAKFDEMSEQRYALRDLNQHFNAAGYKVVDQIYPGLLAYVIAMSAFCFPKLCVGSPEMIQRLFSMETPLYQQWAGKKLSFSTLTLLQAI